MKTLNSTITAVLIAILASTSLTASYSVASTFNVAPPSAFDEGVQTRLSDAQIAAILPWARSSKVRLEDLLKRAARVSPKQGVQILSVGIKDVVLASAPKQTELLMRYTLNRAIKINEMLINGTRGGYQPGLVHQQMRVLTNSIKFALKYYQSDMDFLNSNTTQQLPYAAYGIDHAKFMMELAQGITSAKAQYQVMINAQGLLAWDLMRDRDNAKYAEQISRVLDLQRIMPDTPDFSDQECVERMRTILGNWSDLNLDALNVAEPVTAPVLVSSSSIVKYEEIDQNDDGSITIINPKIMNNGGFLPVGSHSDLNGVCRLYGYATYVYNSAIPYGNFSETALINKDGRFNEIGTSPMFQSRNAIITKITCSNDTQNTPIFKRYDELERNSGGSVTIINPKFGPVEDAVLPLSSHSDLNGVCRLYGYATYVYNSAIPYGNFSETALINEDGRFNKIGTPLMFQSRNAIITKIICR